MPQNVIGVANQDLNGDGKIGGSAVAYDVSQTFTYRPGVIAKLNQDFGMDDSLEYGFWYERARQALRQLSDGEITSPSLRILK